MMNDEPTILIVEDSPTQAEQLRFILERRGYQVTISRNGQDALDAMETFSPALVISDILMPQMDGYQLCGHIKQDQRHKSIPVILLTSLSDPVDVVRGLECGADNFIFKPYEEGHLLARVAYMLANRHLRENESTQMGVEITFAGRRFFITSDRLQILNLLLSTYEAAVHRNKELTSARDELRQLNESLESRVRERTAALQAEVAERKRNEEEVRRLNAELEERVLARTAELEAANEDLEAANEELEAFSYSVSHDLRAPLRHINGFVGLLVDASAPPTPEQSRRYTDTILKATRKMGQLIDDLLLFSRMNRAELAMRPVDLQDLVQEAILALEHETKNRNITWRVGSLPVVQGDRSLLLQVCLNLIGNAIKYTRPRDPAEIEISAEVKPSGQALIQVRDNGVGFDMEQAGKLFGVFQRLHREEDFEGTGIGLANVRRIVSRHGGQTWADSRVDGGARFYFTLPASAPTRAGAS